ncbi:MAG TPA: 7-dehydrocholesterol reductase [Rhabdochlamydiaceae bacterium]|jgi:7-dehydrocholesterol reductase
MARSFLSLSIATRRLRYAAGPFLAIFCLMPLILAVWHANVALEGSLKQLFFLFFHKGFFSAMHSICRPYIFGTACAWQIFFTFLIISQLLFRFLPGMRYYDRSMTSEGALTISKSNGFFVFAALLIGYLIASKFLHLFPATILYDHFAGLVGALNVFSLGVLILSKSTAIKAFHSFYRHFNIFTTCRCAMLGWALMLVSFAAKQQELYGLCDSLIVSMALQLLFIAKFFLWEIGYLRAMDITYDRSGFCLCWGTMVWIPAFYTSPTLYLVHHPHRLGVPLALLFFLCGAACILLNLLVDRQRSHVRNKNGECLVWRKKPDLIFANYTTEWGEEKQNLLLVSGWWGISRHFHYIPELLGAFFWSAPALFSHFLPYFYLSFLAILLVDRAYRHERRCAMKYGKDWEKYCEKVPFRIIPFIY